jgi:hypothetical protein
MIGSRTRGLVALAVLSIAVQVSAYPLDGYERLGIRRLDAYAHSLETGKGLVLPIGARLTSDAITLHLAHTNPDWDLGAAPEDPSLKAAVASIFRGRDPSYAFVVVDFTDPDNVAWAGLRPDARQFPGSVGKVLCLVGLFDALARAFPDVQDRERVLRERTIVASDWATGDSFHKVPNYVASSRTNRFASISAGDQYTLAEWIDHMVSASANSAGATVWKESMLVRRFGSAYPPSLEEEEAFFRETPKLELQRLSQEVLVEPLAAAGVDTTNIRQGTMWTKPGQRRIPGISSYATPRELARILIRLEQGRLVDEWSCVEMKRYLYMTRKRYRYVYASELSRSAVYFKSGSFYRCAPEEGFRCGKYKGNVENLMNSIAIVESPAGPGPEQRRYAVVLFSNVLRENSAWDHARLGAAIDQAVRTRAETKASTSGSEREKDAAGVGD